MSQLQMFGSNIHLLIGLLFSCFGGCILLLAFVIGLKIAWWQGRRWVVGRAIYGQKYDERGIPLPRAFRGACTRCGHIFSVVYAVNDHRQLCTRCYGIERDRPPEALAEIASRGAAEDAENV